MQFNISLGVIQCILIVLKITNLLPFDWLLVLSPLWLVLLLYMIVGFIIINSNRKLLNIENSILKYYEDIQKMNENSKFTDDDLTYIHWAMQMNPIKDEKYEKIMKKIEKRL